MTELSLTAATFTTFSITLLNKELSDNYHLEIVVDKIIKNLIVTSGSPIIKNWIRLCLKCYVE